MGGTRGVGVAGALPITGAVAVAWGIEAADGPGLAAADAAGWVKALADAFPAVAGTFPVFVSGGGSCGTLMGSADPGRLVGASPSVARCLFGCAVGLYTSTSPVNNMNGIYPYNIPFLTANFQHLTIEAQMPEQLSFIIESSVQGTFVSAGSFHRL